MLLGGYIKLAISAMRNARWRSLLTMLGIIIGVVSVVTVVSLGEGVKRQVTGQIRLRGDDLITVLPGERLRRNDEGRIIGFSAPFAANNVSFNEADYKMVSQVEDVELAVPFGQVVGQVKTRDNSYVQAEVIATNEGAAKILHQRLEFGSFFKDDEIAGNGAVIGRTVAEQLFGENVPLGKSLTVREREFVVRGIFEEFPSNNTLLPGINYNNTIFVPYEVGQELMGGNIQISQILVKPSQPEKVDAVIKKIDDSLLKTRSGERDFAVLKHEENLALANNVLSLLTNLVTGIAAISLVVGGIGIMNIMLVSVTERTREIGIRKAVGATNRQILYQFMIEAIVLSVSGGLLGVLLSLLTNFLIRIFTSFQPVITLPVVTLACSVALVVGVLFGVAPALRAARKDPIEALRHE